MPGDLTSWDPTEVSNARLYLDNPWPRKARNSRGCSGPEHYMYALGRKHFYNVGPICLLHCIHSSILLQCVRAVKVRSLFTPLYCIGHVFSTLAIIPLILFLKRYYVTLSSKVLELRAHVIKYHFKKEPFPVCRHIIIKEESRTWWSRGFPGHNEMTLKWQALQTADTKGLERTEL